MRAVAACQFTLNRFGAWHVAVAALTGCVVLTLLFWYLGQSAAWSWWRTAALGFVAVAALGLGASLLRRKAVTLHWDGGRWHVGTAGSTGGEHRPGTLSATVDLGVWMLLRFRADSEGGSGAAVTWLPVQRRGMEPQWHALRCAVYSPRPVPDAGAVADL
jgi:hypothetical protein